MLKYILLLTSIWTISEQALSYELIKVSTKAQKVDLSLNFSQDAMLLFDDVSHLKSLDLDTSDYSMCVDHSGENPRAIAHCMPTHGQVFLVEAGEEPIEKTNFRFNLEPSESDFHEMAKNIWKRKMGLKQLLSSFSDVDDMFYIFEGQKTASVELENSTENKLKGIVSFDNNGIRISNFDGFLIYDFEDEKYQIKNLLKFDELKSISSTYSNGLGVDHVLNLKIDSQYLENISASVYKKGSFDVYAPLENISVYSKNIQKDAEGFKVLLGKNFDHNFKAGDQFKVNLSLQYKYKRQSYMIRKSVFYKVK